MEDQEESSCTVFAGYLQKEGLWQQSYVYMHVAVWAKLLL